MIARKATVTKAATRAFKTGRLHRTYDARIPHLSALLADQTRAPLLTLVNCANRASVISWGQHCTMTWNFAGSEWIEKKGKTPGRLKTRELEVWGAGAGRDWRLQRRVPLTFVKLKTRK